MNKQLTLNVIQAQLTKLIASPKSNLIWPQINIKPEYCSELTFFSRDILSLSNKVKRG